MKVRIAFAVISRLDEPIILVDEVLAVGDRAFREKCYRRIEEMLAGGRTLFFVSHNEKDLQAVLHARPVPRQGRAGAGCLDHRGDRPLQLGLRAAGVGVHNRGDSVDTPYFRPVFLGVLQSALDSVPFQRLERRLRRVADDQLVPSDPVTGAPASGRGARPVERSIDRLLSVQRPLVLAHLRRIRAQHPDADPARVIAILERRYLAAVTSGGAAVGASAVIPGVGVGISLALSGAETAGFLETSALFAQSVTEVHGIAVDDPERARNAGHGHDARLGGLRSREATRRTGGGHRKHAKPVLG